MVTLALIRDTFREALARKIFWVLFGLSTLLILFFLFLLRIDIVAGATATVSLFGRQGPGDANVDRLVRGVYGGIATFLYTWGMFLAVFASAGLVPSVLEPGRIELLLSKPLSRTHILLGRFAGNVLVVSLNTTYLVLGVWIILGIKTGIWSPGFLIAIATTTFIFAVLLAVVVLIGVTIESAAAATMITVALMIISPILAQTSLMMRLLSSEWSRNLWRVLYYALPKVYEIGKMTLDAIQSRTFDGYLPIWTSALFGAVMLGGGAGDLRAERFLVGRPLPIALAFFLLAGCQPKQSASLHISPALETLVPSDTVVVLGVNLAAIRDTTIYQKLITRVPLPQLDRFTQQTGLDPRKDLSEILLCSNGKSALLLVRGKFRLPDLEARFKSNGVTPANYKGHALFGDDNGRHHVSGRFHGRCRSARGASRARSISPAPAAAFRRRCATCCARCPQAIRFMPRSPAAWKI